MKHILVTRRCPYFIAAHWCLELYEVRERKSFVCRAWFNPSDRARLHINFVASSSSSSAEHQHHRLSFTLFEACSLSSKMRELVQRELLRQALHLQIVRQLALRRRRPVDDADFRTVYQVNQTQFFEHNQIKRSVVWVAVEFVSLR